MSYTQEHKTETAQPTKVWLGYDCFYDGGMGTYKTLRKVFNCDVKAILWTEEIEHTDYDWREYEGREVE